MKDIERERGKRGGGLCRQCDTVSVREMCSHAKIVSERKEQERSDERETRPHTDKVKE